MASSTDPTKLFVVCSWRKQLSIPLTRFEADAYAERCRKAGYERVAVWCWVDARHWL